MARGAAIKKDDPARSASLEAAIEHFVVISGLSGAGKSQASKLFEDLGYSCVDNLPPALLDDFLALRRTDPDRYRRTALVLDIRGGDPAPAIQRAAASLADDGARLQLIYLEASDSSLISRYSETRHRHPLQASRSSVQASIAEERGRLAGTRELADHVIDTSGLSIGQLKDRLFAVIPRLSATRRPAHRHRHVRLQVRHPARGRSRVRRPVPDEPVLGPEAQAALRPRRAGPRLRPRPAGGKALPRPRGRAARAHRAGVSGRGQGAAARGARLHGRLPPLDRAGRGARRRASAKLPKASVDVFHRELER